LVARVHHQKDHRNFVTAAGIVHRRRPDIHFMLCGDDVSWQNHALVEWIDEAGIRDQCRLLGPRDDIARLLAALDVASSSSCTGEAFPMAVGEAMACGVPCVVTDVGDSAYLVGDTGLVVSPRDSAALANAWLKLLELSSENRRELGLAARTRVQSEFNVTTIAARYEEVYHSVLDRQPSRFTS
jgi:glycosyltransferase involved in cell wall biosynthesis